MISSQLTTGTTLQLQRTAGDSQSQRWQMVKSLAWQSERALWHASSMTV